MIMGLLRGFYASTLAHGQVARFSSGKMSLLKVDRLRQFQSHFTHYMNLASLTAASMLQVALLFESSKHSVKPSQSCLHQCVGERSLFSMRRCIHSCFSHPPVEFPLRCVDPVIKSLYEVKHLRRCVSRTRSGTL